MGNTHPIPKETLEAKVKAAGCAPDPPLLFALRLKGYTDSSKGLKERSKVVDELKRTPFPPGTIGDVALRPGSYSMRDRTACTKLIEAGEPMHYATGFEEKPPCCAIL